MATSPKRTSARRSLFPSPDEAVAPTPPSSPPPALMTLPPHSQSASNSANLLPSQRLKNKSPAQQMDEGKPSQQPGAGHPSPGMASSSSANDGVQEEEKEKASDNESVQAEKEKACDNDGVQEEEKEKASVNEGLEEKASTNDGVQEEKEEALKTDLPASCPESNPPAGEKKKPGRVRVWSVEDDVRILEFLAAYVKDNGAPPVRAKLCDVVRGHALDKKEFTLRELYEKVRRMRDRYYAMRGMADAGAPPRGDAEDLHKYELSGKIWGDSLPVPKPEIKQNGSGQAPPEACVRREFEELRRMYPQLTLLVEQIAADGRGFLKRAFEFIGDSKARELDAKVKKLRVAEMKIQVERSSSRKEVLRTLVKYMES